MAHLQACFLNIFKASSLLILLYYPTIVTCECTCEVEDLEHGKGEALKFKLGTIQVCVHGNNGNAFLPDNAGGNCHRNWNF
ncbi:hypothetical protein D5086_016111 [Populus alba]|uniref:Uncharacterized protein n=1 Tax=Populus alba TaxID=43335 RepID=A0ACC4BTE0_POPAL